jgi:hypothetical protein
VTDESSRFDVEIVGADCCVGIIWVFDLSQPSLAHMCCQFAVFTENGPLKAQVCSQIVAITV